MPPHRRHRCSPFLARVRPCCYEAPPPLGPLPGRSFHLRVGYCGRYAPTQPKAKSRNLLLLIFVKGEAQGTGVAVWRSKSRNLIIYSYFFHGETQGTGTEAQNPDLQRILSACAQYWAPTTIISPPRSHFCGQRDLNHPSERFKSLLAFKKKKKWHSVKSNPRLKVKSLSDKVLGVMPCAPPKATAQL